MFITKIIKSKKVGCILKLNITASTLYCTQAMENEFKNKSEAYFNTVKSENSENKFINKTQYKFILIEDLKDISFNKKEIKELNDIKFNKEEKEELKELLKLTDKDKNINIYKDSDFLNYNNEIVGSIELDELKKEDDEFKKEDDEFEKENSTGSFGC